MPFAAVRNDPKLPLEATIATGAAVVVLPGVPLGLVSEPFGLVLVVVCPLGVVYAPDVPFIDTKYQPRPTIIIKITTIHTMVEVFILSTIPLPVLKGR